LATSAELFHSNDGNGYAEIKIGGERTHRETYAINSRDFKRWLTREYYRRTTSAPSSNAMATALLTIEAKAQFDGPEREVFLRAAGHDGKFYLDLCDADWRVLEIDAQGWRLVANPPVRFIRRKGMKALPLPKRFWTLKKYINVPNRADSRLR
jgi:hypothetical protein